ncbi:MAG: hypothetical protein ACI89J_003986, partial [Hyphomicrobiaceae bacterium]
PDALCVCEFPIIHAEKMARYETSRQKPFLDRLRMKHSCCARRHAL